MINSITCWINNLPKPFKEEIVFTSLLSTAAAIVGLGAPFYQVGNRLFDNGLSSLASSVSYSSGMSTYCWMNYSFKKLGVSDVLSQVISALFALICAMGVYVSLNSFSTQTKCLVASVNLITHVTLCFALK